MQEEIKKYDQVVENKQCNAQVKNSINNGPVLLRGVNAQCAQTVHISRAQCVIKLTIMRENEGDEKQTQTHIAEATES